MNCIKLTTNRYNLVNLCIALLGCTLIFVAIEIKYPYFFLRDDNADSYLGIYTYCLRCLSEGKFPFYCFNEFCGQRFYAAGQTGILNPLIAFAAFVSNIFCGKTYMMMDLLAYFSIIIGCTGAFFLLKKLECSDTSAIIGAIIWNFNAYNIWEGTSWIVVVYTTSVFPYFLLTSLKLLEKSSLRNLILSIIPRVYLFYLGHPQFFIFAAIFDCLFIGFICITTKGTDRFKSLGKLVKDYFIVYISTTFLVLPLLIPEYQFTQLSFDYGSARSYESLLYEMWFDGKTFFCPWLYTEDNHCYFYPPFIGYLLMLFLLAGVFLLVFLFLEPAYSKYKKNGKKMLALLPCLILCYFLLFNYGAIKIVSYIPILNRFQYYHRTSIYFTAFEIIFACLSMTVIGSLYRRKHKPSAVKTKTIACLLIVLEVVSFAVLYTFKPHLGRGPMYDTTKLYDYEFASQFTGGRYVTVGYYNNDQAFNKEIHDLSENLDYNLQKLYGINNLSGYAGFLNYKDVIQYNECFGYIGPIKGSILFYYPGMIEQMREQSVCWYVINPVQKADFEAHAKEYGIDFVSESEHSVIYYDSYAQPYAYDSKGNEVKLVQDVNTLILNTESKFQGGEITLNYTYDPNFKCYIDGKETTIKNEPEKWQFVVNCEAGEHEIIVQYEDSTFFVCLIITSLFIFLSVSSIIIYKQIRRRQSIQHA